MIDGRGPRLQSAMEYLMTYGWAILIIAVVLGALFQLGVFNATNFAPRVPAGACQVERLATQTALTGECQGGLPQYVALQNGGSSYIYASLTSWFGGNNPLTASEWVNVEPSYIGPTLGITGSPPDGDWCMTTLAFNGVTSTVYGRMWALGVISYATTPGWHFIAITYDPSGSGTTTLYVDGSAVANEIGQYSSSGEVDYWTTDEICQNIEGGSGHLAGMLANVQAYNTTLSGNDLQALYLEGIGGAPIRVQNIIGWWPLNGNANDYSGNNNNGVLSGVTYTPSWTGSYTTP